MEMGIEPQRKYGRKWICNRGVHRESQRGGKLCALCGRESERWEMEGNNNKQSPISLYLKRGEHAIYPS